MKKVFSLAIPALAALALASCQQDETLSVNTGKAIRFNAFLNNTTRATQVTKDSLKSFQVVAITDASADPAHGFSFKDVFSTTDYTNWNSTQPHYWPGEETMQLKFYAYSPTNAELTTYFGNAASSTVDWNSVAPSGNTLANLVPVADAAKQKDLVVAYKEGTRQQNETSGVALNFQHALSQVTIKAQNDNSTNMQVLVKGVKLVVNKGQGTLTFPTNTETDNLVAQTAWTTQQVDSKVSSYMLGGTDQTAIPLDGTPKAIGNGQSFMVLPQQLTAWNGTSTTADGAYLSVLCRISQSDGNGGWNLLYPTKTDANNQDMYAFAAVPISTNFEPGKNYIYTLKFFSNGGGAGVTDPDPTDPTEPDPDPEIDDDYEGGHDIVGGKIYFTVEVQGWQDVATELPMD